MTKKQMSRDAEYDFYAHAENQSPQGLGRRRRGSLNETVPVRFDPDTPPSHVPPSGLPKSPGPAEAWDSLRVTGPQ